MKILLSAYACEPLKGSEPGVGWKWANELSSRNNKVTVITRKNNKKNIKKKLKNRNKIKFIYFDLPNLFIKFKSLSKSFSYLYFYLWQIGIYFKIKKLIKKKKFDLIHHVSFVTYRIPSFLSLLNIPFIFGPIAGGEQVPKQFLKNFHLKSKIFEYLRRLSNSIIKYSPIINLILKNSSIIIVNSIQTKKFINKNYHYKTIKELAIAPKQTQIKKNLFIENKKIESFNMCFVGDYEDHKGIFIILKIILKLKNNHHKFNFCFIGSGGLKTKMKNFIDINNLNSFVRIYDKMPQSYVFKKMQRSHLLLFPALRDSGGMVLFEAMQHGLPSAVLDLGGPGQIIDKECGIIVKHENKSEEKIINDFYISISKLIKDNAKLKKLSRNCLKRLKLFKFENKINKIYNNKILLKKIIF